MINKQGCDSIRNRKSQRMERTMRKIRRREFLKASVGTAAFLGAPLLFTSCDQQNINAQVAAIRGEQ